MSFPLYLRYKLNALINFYIAFNLVRKVDTMSKFQIFPFRLIYQKLYKL